VRTCPQCGHVAAEPGPAKPSSAAKLHLERKHYLEVVEGDAEKKRAEG